LDGRNINNLFIMMNIEIMFTCHVVTKREGSYLHTESSNPWIIDWSWLNILPADLQAHLHLVCLLIPAFYTWWIGNIPHSATEPRSQESISFLPSLSHTQTPTKRNILLYHLQIIYTPRAQALLSGQILKNIQTFQFLN
jgi:hypothetical protein